MAKYYTNTHFLPSERYKDYDLIRAKCHFFGAGKISQYRLSGGDIRIDAIFSRKEWAEEAYANVEEFIGDIGKSCKIADWERLKELANKVGEPVLV